MWYSVTPPRDQFLLPFNEIDVTIQLVAKHVFFPAYLPLLYQLYKFYNISLEVEKEQVKNSGKQSGRGLL
jgi:hypothetical protein